MANARFLALSAVLALASCSSSERESQGPAPAPATDDAGTAPPDAEPGDGPTAAEHATFERVRKEMESALHAAGIPGGSIAIVLRKKLAFAAGVGVKRQGEPDPVTPDSLFRVASMTKPIVAAGVLQQAEAGAIDLDRSLRGYVPEFGRAEGHDSRAVRVRHLLTHTSGIPDTRPTKCSTDPSYLAKWTAARSVDPLWSPPGRLYNYSNANYAFAALALQKVARTGFDAYLRDRVLAPFGMTTATFDPAAAGDDRTTGHGRAADTSGRTYDFSQFDCAVSRAYMGVIASAKDYARFAEALMDGGRGVLSPASIAQMEADQAGTGLGEDQAIGAGLFHFDWRGARVHGHDGRAYGWESSFVYVPSEGFAVVVLVNADDYPPMSLALGALDAFLGTAGAPPDRSSSPSTWPALAGTYDDPVGALGEMIVSFADDRLVVDLPRYGVRGDMHGYAGDGFGFWIDSAWVPGTFFRDAGGAGEYFATRGGVARRIAPAPTLATKPPSSPAPASVPPPGWSFALAVSHAHRANAPAPSL